MPSPLLSPSLGVYLALLPVFQVQGHSQPSQNNSTGLRNLSLFPVCVRDQDCTKDRACFQYMCLPWQSSTGFRWCSDHSDCTDLTRREGGTGKNGHCFKHQDTNNIQFGICLNTIETKTCWSHSDCPAYLRCTNGYCGDKEYFRALQERSCEEDEECESLLTGEMCCYDLSLPGRWKAGPEGMRRRCCNNPSGSPVIRPSNDIGQKQLDKLDKGISDLAVHLLDMIVCEGLSYEMMLKLSSCKPYRRTTTTTDRTNQMHHTGGGASVTMGYSVIIAVIGNIWTAITMCYCL